MIPLHPDDRCVCPIAENEVFDRQLESAHRLQVLDIQLKAAVAVDTDRPPFAARDARADGPGQSGAHCP